MTTEQFLKYAVDMCKKCSENNCEKCEASPGASSCWHSTNPDFLQVEQVVQNWINRNYVTRKALLFTCFPNVSCDKNGCPYIDACTVEPSWKLVGCERYETCGDCNKDFWLSPP